MESNFSIAGIVTNSVWDSGSSLNCEVYSSPDSSLQTENAHVFKILKYGFEQAPKPATLEKQTIQDNSFGDHISDLSIPKVR